MSADLFFRRLRGLPAAERAALKAAAANPLVPDVDAHDGFTTVYWGSGFRRETARIAAALYFWHPARGTLRLPQALARAGGRDRRRHERLLADVLAAPLAGLPPLLFEAVRRLHAARVPLDWPRFLNDLARWDRPATDERDRIQDDWAECWLDAVSPPSRS